MQRATEYPIEIDHLLAKQALHELCTGYSRAVDRLDEPALVDLFYPDAFIDSGVLRGDPVSFARQFAAWIREHARVTSHAVTNEWFLIDGDRAIGESYVVAVARLRGDVSERDVVTFGRYLDRFERRSGMWKFTERRFVLDHSVTSPETAPLPEAASPEGGRGAFAPQDVIYGFWPRPRR